MEPYTRKIDYRSDVLGFFIHLQLDLRLDFHPDDSFENYIDPGTPQTVLHAETYLAYENILNACRLWCTANGQDIFRIAREATQFPAFLATYKKITHPKQLKTFAKEFIDEKYDTRGIVAMHTYGGCYWIEETLDKGRPLFQCIIENTNPFADNLRDMEVILFDWTDKHALPSEPR